MASLFDRLNHELEALGKRAQSALDEGKSQIELMRVRRARDHAALELGLMFHRQERGKEIDAARMDVLLWKLDDLAAELESVERDVNTAGGATAGADSGTGAEPAEPPPAEPVTTAAAATEAVAPE